MDNVIEYLQCRLSVMNIPRGPPGISVIQLMEEELALAGSRYRAAIDLFVSA